MTRALEEERRQPLRPDYVLNAPVLENLLAALRDDDSTVELIGLYGTGKTTLLKALQYDRPSMFDGTVEYFLGSPSYPLLDAVDTIAERFRASKGRSLLIIDEAERMDKGELLEGINRLGTGPWRFSTILATTAPLDVGRTVHITPLNFEDTSRLFEVQLGQSLSREARAKLWAVHHSIPGASI